jgi:hypothetical protein
LQQAVVAAQDDVILARQQILNAWSATGDVPVSTLNEIAANHARMAKLKEEESMRLSALQTQIVGSFEMPSTQPTQEIPLHFLVGVQDHSFGETAALVF